MFVKKVINSLTFLFEKNPSNNAGPGQTAHKVEDDKSLHYMHFPRAPSGRTPVFIYDDKIFICRNGFGILVKNRPNGSVAQLAECSHGKREALSSSPDRTHRGGKTRGTTGTQT